MENQKEMPSVEATEKEIRKAYFPPYWEKRKKKLKRSLSRNSRILPTVK